MRGIDGTSASETPESEADMRVEAFETGDDSSGDSAVSADEPVEAKSDDLSAMEKFKVASYMLLSAFSTGLGEGDAWAVRATGSEITTEQWADAGASVQDSEEERKQGEAERLLDRILAQRNVPEDLGKQPEDA